MNTMNEHPEPKGTNASATTATTISTTETKEMEETGDPNTIQSLIDLPASFRLTQKITSLNTTANVSMAWYVSSVVFCGSILAAVWLSRIQLVETGIIKPLGFILALFFGGVAFFGSVIVKYVVNSDKDISGFLGNPVSKGKPVPKHFFSTEISMFKLAMIVGTISFMLIEVCWLFLWIGLWLGYWGK